MAYTISGPTIADINPFSADRNKPDSLSYPDIGILEVAGYREWVNGDKSWIPTSKGVYVIYNFEGIPLYVGQTGEGNATFKTRLPKETYIKYLRTFSKWVKFYTIEDALTRLLFERIKISQLNPLLNRDPGNLLDERNYTNHDICKGFILTLILCRRFLEGINEDTILSIAAAGGKRGGLNGILMEMIPKLEQKLASPPHNKSSADIKALLKRNSQVTFEGLINALKELLPPDRFEGLFPNPFLEGLPEWLVTLLEEE